MFNGDGEQWMMNARQATTRVTSTQLVIAVTSMMLHASIQTAAYQPPAALPPVYRLLQADSRLFHINTQVTYIRNQNTTTHLETFTLADVIDYVN